MPGFVEFQHPKLVDKPPTGDGWLHEIKFDGYRMQVRVCGGRATIYTRNGHDWTDRLPELAAAVATLPDVILDGELCALGEGGESDFSALRAALSPGKTGRLVYFAFDQLWEGREDLRPYALKARMAVLARTLAMLPGAALRGVDAFPIGGAALLESACRLGLEGIVSKRLDADYRGGRVDTWVKAKCRPSQEVVIGGWVQEPGGVFKAILTGVYGADGRLVYAGSVKSGFSRAHGLLTRLTAREQVECPFAAGSPPRKTREIRWARPDLVAQVDFAEWTASGKLRQATFKGLREDKTASDVRRDAPGADAL